MKLLRALLVLAGFAFLAMFLYVAFRRVRWPHELDWLGGAILDHIERIRSGQPIYTAPSADWIPFLYPPLHYFVGAAMPSFFGLRLLSIASTLVTAACVWRMSRTHGAEKFWAWVAAGLFFACYSLCGFWYDVEHCDSLCVALLMAGAVVGSESRGVLGAALGGLLFGAACLTKQPALLLLGAAFLVLLKHPARAFAFLGTSLLLIASIALWQQSRGGGWFFFYVVKMPLWHGIDPHLAWPLLQELPRVFALCIATFGVLPTLWRKPSLFAALLFAAFIASAWNRLHAGGQAHALVFWIPLACVAVALLASRIEKLLAGNMVALRALELLTAVVLAQFALLAYDPRAQIPKHGEILDHTIARVRELESHGEVLMPVRGHVTAKRHFHLSALDDLLRLKPMPDDLAAAIAKHRYAAILLRSPNDLPAGDYKPTAQLEEPLVVLTAGPTSPP